MDDSKDAFAKIELFHLVSLTRMYKCMPFHFFLLLSKQSSIHWKLFNATLQKVTGLYLCAGNSFTNVNEVSSKADWKVLTAESLGMHKSREKEQNLSLCQLCCSLYNRTA
jgi:hypothetical protein